MNWKLRSSAIHRSHPAKSPVWSKKPANWKKVYASLKSCSYDAAGNLPPKSQDLVDTPDKANVAITIRLLWWIAGGVDALI